jgi:hypothetical protein
MLICYKHHFAHKFEFTNTYCGSKIERTAIGIVADNQCLGFPGAFSEKCQEDEGAEPMEEALDQGNFFYSDYLSAKRSDSRKSFGYGNPYAHRVDCEVAWTTPDRRDTTLPVMDPLYPAPDIWDGSYADRDIELCVVTCDLELSSTARPIQRNELLKIIGFSEATANHLALADWQKVRLIARSTTPKETLSRLFSALLVEYESNMDKTAKKNDIFLSYTPEY